jgi:hypothetical protein
VVLWKLPVSTSPTTLSPTRGAPSRITSAASKAVKKFSIMNARGRSEMARTSKVGAGVAGVRQSAALPLHVLECYCCCWCGQPATKYHEKENDDKRTMNNIYSERTVVKQLKYYNVLAHTHIS